MKPIPLTAIAALTGLLLSSPALSQIRTGSDNGSAVGGPNPSSATAETDFFTDAAGYGAIYTLDFEGLSTGYSTSYLFPGVSVSTTSPNYGSGFSGVTDSTVGNLYGYDIDSGTGTWFGVPGGETTFSFDSPTNSFGFYLTGLQTVYGSGLVVTDSLGNVYNIASNTDGGAQYFGVTTATPVGGFSISDANSQPDAWGIDRLSFLRLSPAVPEPSTWAMMLVGFGAIGFSVRGARKQRAIPQVA